MSKREHCKVRLAMRHRRHVGMLFLCDLVLLAMVDFLILVIYPSSVAKLSIHGTILQMVLGAASIFACRFLGGIYRYVWRYGSYAQYLQLIVLDAIAGCLYFWAQKVFSAEGITFIRALSIVALNLLATITSRMVYQFLYEYSRHTTKLAGIIRRTMSVILGVKNWSASESMDESRKINIAIVGAGRVGAMLAEHLITSPGAQYKPCCFVDIDREKIGRNIKGIPILGEEAVNQRVIEKYRIQEIVLALPDVQDDRKKELYEQYRRFGCKVKVYDYPIGQSVYSGKRRLREFDIEELLFRKPVHVSNKITKAYYKGKKVLISGGGGSIGSELCRQIAKLEPARLIVLDVYENSAYDLQQELKIAYQGKLDLVVEIASVCDREALEHIFRLHRPDVVLHAAAHKHVPLMERNCCEAVRNNVFGTLNMVELSEQYGVKKFTMISTDKAVNPTNVMGATKRMCEMIVQSRKKTETNFSATRFGNVLGSNGSVIPLFKRQIAAGGPVTITDKRIIRYFMTIPEASQLVLQSSAIAKNGELYVLDMGKPVKILELAEEMIRLSGLEPYRDIDIIETGLRPGEKLYEELLIKHEELDRTQNDLIFVERDKPKDEVWVAQQLDVLRKALVTGDDEIMRRALKQVVRSYRSPEDVNEAAAQSEEMKRAAG